MNGHNTNANRLSRGWVGLILFSLLSGAGGLGCAAAPSDGDLRKQAVTAIRRGLSYQASPTVRAHATEAACETDLNLFVRQQLEDPHPVVRFAAGMALGRARDRGAIDALRKMTQDPDGSVRVASYFALERMGVSDYRSAWHDALLKDENTTVRRNAALAFGQSQDKQVIPLLRRASAQDADEGVRLQSREALALLGDPDAVDRFIHDTYGGAGFRQPFALLTLGQVQDSRVVPALRRGLAHADYIEARLAAARGLALHGNPEGYGLALKSLGWNQPAKHQQDDSRQTQVMRVRMMAAMALGEMGDRRALGALYQRMRSNKDPRVQLAAAAAILKILDRAPAPDKVVAQGR